jgi:hypothetical protein
MGTSALAFRQADYRSLHRVRFAPDYSGNRPLSFGLGTAESEMKMASCRYLLLLLVTCSLLSLGGCLGSDDDDSAIGDDDDTTVGDDDDSAAGDDDDTTVGDDDDSAAGDDDDSAAGDDDDTTVGDDDDSAAGDDDDSAAGDDDDSAGGSSGAALTCPQNDSYEANDSFATAHDLGALGLGTTTVEGILCSGTLASGGDDEDWFSFSITGVMANCYDLTVSSAALQGVDVDRTNHGGTSQTTGTTAPGTDVEMLDINVPTISHKVGLSRGGNSTALARRFTMTIEVKGMAACN